MGRDKATLPWGETTLLQHIIDLLKPNFSELLLVVDDCSRYAHLGIEVAQDQTPGKHSIGGLYTGLELASNPLSFVCACDSPFLNQGLIDFLFQQASGYDLIIPKSNGGLEPLHAVYARSALPLIKTQIDRDDYALHKLPAKLSSKIIGETALRQLDPQLLSFFNINTDEQYRQALKL